MPPSVPLARPLTARPLTSRRPDAPLSGRTTVPGDKSISHRALMLATLAVGHTRIAGLLEGEDVLCTAKAMRALGARIRQQDGSWHVDGVGIGGLAEPEDVLDMGNSGTAARLLAGILASHDMVSVMTGDASLRRRPMARIITPLAATGARFVSRSGGRLPLTIEGARRALPLDYTLPVASAQVKSAILLAGLNARGVTRVVEPTPTRDHTEAMLRHFGAILQVERTDGETEIRRAGGETEMRRAGETTIRLLGQPELVARDLAIPGDPSSAAFPLVAALLVPGSVVTVEGVGLNPLRTGLLTTLREMGAALTVTNQRLDGGEPVGDITAEHRPLFAVDVPASRAPAMIDEYPILAVVAACARGATRLRGLAELRVKESDRLAATAALLIANGAVCTIEGDDLLIHGLGRPPAGGATVATHMDHRLAMSALILGLATDRPVTADDTRFIDTSFPGFVALMSRLGATLE